MFHYTGHALVDVGIATLTAYAGHYDPSLLAETDLATAAQALFALFTQSGPMRNFARGAVFLNAGYTASADPEKQRRYGQRVLESWRADAPRLPGEKCIFCGEEAAYRATREEVPLSNGRGFSAGYATERRAGACGMKCFRWLSWIGSPSTKRIAPG